MKKDHTAGSLSLQALVGVTLGVVLGFVAQQYASALRPLGEGVINLVRMLISPMVLTTVVVGAAQIGR